MSTLICPKCENSKLTWLEFDAEDFDCGTGIMQCKGCKTTFVGISGWQKAWDAVMETKRARGKEALERLEAYGKEMGWLE